MTPFTVRGLLDTIEANTKSFKHALRWVLVGGKHFPVQQKKRALDRLGPIIHEYYGTTESGVNTIAEPHDLENHPRSVGLPFDGNAIAIIGPGGSRLGAEEIGTVAVASYMNMDYYSDGSSNRIVFDGENYLPTSEKGYLDQEGRLYLLNRSAAPDNLYNIYGLEDAIRALPCVADVALLSSENQSGSQVDCAVQIKYKAKVPSQLRDDIRKLISKEQMHLLCYRVVPQIPYSPSGKVKVRDLELLLSGPCCNRHRS
jgi:acyl-coenzyme A synthetase/AMP-(fatty) acid ligase